MNDEAHVNDVIGKPARRQSDGGCSARLHELDPIALRIVHLEPAVPGRRGDGIRNLQARVREIVAQALSVRRREGDMVEAIDRGRSLWQGQYFDKLRGAEVITHAEAAVRVCTPGCPEVMNIEALSRGGLGCIHGDMGDPEDWRPGARGECGRECQAQQEPQRTVA
jgi:hypothetical protein